MLSLNGSLAAVRSAGHTPVDLPVRSQRAQVDQTVFYTDSKGYISMMSAPYVPNPTEWHQTRGARWQLAWVMGCSAIEEPLNYGQTFM